MVQQTMWEDVLLHTARLIDREVTGRKANLTVRRLPSAVADPMQSAELAKLVNDAVSRCDAARQWRHAHLAHRDLGRAMGAGTITLPAVTLNVVEDALDSIRSIMRVLDPTVLWGEPLVRGDAEDLLYYLERGMTSVDEEDRLADAGHA
jgi:hypothetical protein